MKHPASSFLLLAMITLVACAAPQVIPTETAASDPAVASPAAAAMLTTVPTQTTTDEEAEITGLVENFGKKLQVVSLLAPDAAQEIDKQYAEFVDPALLETWMNNVAKAPGRMVSSPWPDRIEITGVSRENPDRYAVTGFVIEITSTEVGSDQAAAKIPVSLVLERRQGRWLITQYAEER